MTTGRLSPAPRARTAHEHARATLRAGILDRTLPAGTRLVQTDLAQQLGISTTPVREALRDLVSEGLVLFDPHRGAIVRPLEIGEVREIYELRVALEPIMVRRVVERITEAQLARAESLADRMESAPDMSTWVTLNRDFHAVFSEVDDTSRLAGILAGLRDSAAGYVAVSLDARPAHIPESNVEHRELLEIYRRRDVEEAVRVTVAHLLSTLAIIETAAEKGMLDSVPVPD
jgi:DNA-binding GntR family transcriptional regulator